MPVGPVERFAAPLEVILAQSGPVAVDYGALRLIMQHVLVFHVCVGGEFSNVFKVLETHVHKFICDFLIRVGIYELTKFFRIFQFSSSIIFRTCILYSFSCPIPYL